jgi:lactoylglutathione lyase
MRRELFPILASSELRARVQWYTEVFDAVEAYRFPETGDPVYLTVTIGDSTLGLADAAGGTAYGEQSLPATGHAVDLCVYVDDLDDTMSRGGQRGSVAVPATDMPWGERVGWLRDPEGVMLLVIQADATAG